MKFMNDNPKQPLRFEKDGKVIGQFYNSVDGTYHLSEYVPYKFPPKVYLCGKTGNFSATRNTHLQLLCKNCCEKMQYEK